MPREIDQEALEAAARALTIPDFWDDAPEMNISRHQATAAIRAYLATLWKPIETAPPEMVLFRNSGLGTPKYGVGVWLPRVTDPMNYHGSNRVPVDLYGIDRSEWRPTHWLSLDALDAAAGGADA